METCSLKIEEVVFREDLYPRFEPHQDLIETYSQSTDKLPPIMVSQNYILIDGFHRWKAHTLAKEKTIKVEIVQVANEKDLKRLAYETNSKHGLQLTSDEKRKYACEMIGIETVGQLAKTLSVSDDTIERWTKAQRKSQTEEKERLILELHLRAEITQQMIESKTGVPQTTISDKIIGFTENPQMRIFGKDWGLGEGEKDHDSQKPYLYNIWRLAEAEEKRWFGRFPMIYMENLLYYYTEPFQIVYDPFAGSGTTVDACKTHYRRYYCSDRIIYPGREGDIKQWDVVDGIPDDLPKPDFVFIDPPYWKQAEGQYSEDKQDLGNMPLADFYECLGNFFKQLYQKMNEGAKLALIIQGTQWKNNMIFEDHAFKIGKGLAEIGFLPIMRIICPYSTQQYTPQMVTRAKIDKIPLVLHRDIIVLQK